MACLCCLASCISLEEGFIPETGKNHTVEVMASVEGFDKFNVGTKAIEDDESKVSELTMIIYDSQGNIVGDKINLSGANSVFMIETLSNNNDPNAKPYIIYGTNKIDIQNDQEYLEDCTIYMIANSASVLYNDTMEENDDDPSVATITALEALTFPVTSISIPSEGFPMVGCQSNVNLSRTRGTNETTTKLDIPMKKLFAKINVSFQINATVIQTPRFQLTGWTVSNVPSKVSFVEPEYTVTEDDKGNKTKVYNQETVCAKGAVLQPTEPSTVLSAGKPTILHSPSLENPDRFQFTFYMPEQIVKPNKTITYPAGIPNDEKQRYKPHLCESPKTPTYVTVTGIYTDLHGQVHEVAYSLYLGQNNTDNFEIYRNQQVNNIITIKGITNSHSNNCDDINTNGNFSNDNISADHRVDVEEKDFSIAIEREALLDSHFEVRPMDIHVGKGKVVLTVNGDWMRMEKPFGGNTDNGGENSPYIASAKGVRKYFTTNLVTETLNNDAGRTITINAGDEPRIWLYFDENPNHYDKTIPGSQMYRDISVTVDYFAEDNTTETPTRRQIITFRQMNLWRVWNADKSRYYDIEYHEEYLYNYASDDNYGKRKDGMDWGLDGIQLSHIHDAFYINSGVNNILDWILELFGWSKEKTLNESFGKLNPRPKYDFYLPTDTAQPELTVRGFRGLVFNQEITTYLLNNYSTNEKAKLNGVQLNEDPKSAISYCYNKNKRNINGGVDNLYWYLPASDEIEEVAKSAYQEFDGVFQGNLYWSCQPAYHNRKIDLDVWRRERSWTDWIGEWADSEENIQGYYFLDNVNRARATRALAKNGQFERVLSSASDEEGTQYGRVYADAVYRKDAELTNYVVSNTTPYENHQGNLARSGQHARVRCIRNSGTAAN